MHKNPSFQSTGPPGLLNRLLSSISSRRSPATMRCLPLSFLSTLAATLLGGLATPLAPHWDRMRVKHAWDAVPENWENLGHPPHATTIDLHLALKSHNENALIDALHEVSDPESPKYVSHHLFAYACIHLSRCPVTDTARTFPKSRSLRLSRRTRTLSSSLTPGLSTTGYLPPPSQRHSAATG